MEDILDATPVVEYNSYDLRVMNDTKSEVKLSCSVTVPVPCIFEAEKLNF